MADDRNRQPDTDWICIDCGGTWAQPTRDGRQYPVGYCTRSGPDHQRFANFARVEDLHGASPSDQPTFHDLTDGGGQADGKALEGLGSIACPGGPKGMDLVNHTSTTHTITKGPGMYLDPELAFFDLKVNPRLQGFDGDSEQFLPRYTMRKRPGPFFGRMFGVPWSEAAAAMKDDTLEDDDVVTSSITSKSEEHGDLASLKHRRFVVIREGHLSCTAVPIITYSRHGVAKNGVRKSDHASIYTGNTLPRPKHSEWPQRGEKPLAPDAIKVVADSPQNKLSDMSRIKYGKVHTIEHNTKVRSFGKVSPESIDSQLNNSRTVQHWPDDWQEECHSFRHGRSINIGMGHDPGTSTHQTDPRSMRVMTELRALGFTAGQAMQIVHTRQATTFSTFQKALKTGRSPEEAFLIVQKMHLPHTFLKLNTNAAGRRMMIEAVTSHYILGPLLEYLTEEDAAGRDQEDDNGTDDDNNPHAGDRSANGKREMEMMTKRGGIFESATEHVFNGNPVDDKLGDSIDQQPRHDNHQFQTPLQVHFDTGNSFGVFSNLGSGV